MGNGTDKEDGGDAQKDEIPRDTQLDKQYIESPSNKDVLENQDLQANQLNQYSQINQATQINQANQINQGNLISQANQINQSNQNYVVMQGGQQYSLGKGSMQYQVQQENQEIEPNVEGVQYQVNQQYEAQGIQQNDAAQYNQEYQENQAVQGNQEYYANQEMVDNQDMGENQEVMEGEEGEEYVEGEEVEIIEGDGEEAVEGEEIVEGENQLNQVENQYQVDQQGNNQVNQESRSYQINRDGKVYQVNEETKQYTVNSGDNNYQIKKEYKATKIEQNLENSPNYPNNSYSQAEGKTSQSKTSIKKTTNILPKDSIPKVYIQSSRYNDNYPSGRYTQYYSDIPRYMSFQKSNIKNTSKVQSNVNVVKTENISELVEIPRSEYQNYAGRETIFIGGGMDTGEYKFRGQGIVITQAQVPAGKIVISEEDILKEINRRKNKPKKTKKRRYEVLDRFYAITEFDGKPIKKIEKVEQQQKQKYEYEEQEKYYTTSKGKVGYQFSSKESQSQQIQNQPNQPSQLTQSNQSQQFQFQQSQQMQSQQSLAQTQSQIEQMKLKYIQSQNQNINDNNNMNINTSDNYMVDNNMNINMSDNNMNINTSNNMNVNMNESNNMNMNINMNDNNYKFQQFILNSAPSDNYSKYLLEQINKLRADPQSYIGIIEDAKNNIIRNKHGRLVYNGKIKIGLTDGESAFNNAINYLKSAKSAEKLIFNPYITVDLPKTENEIKYKNDLRLKVEDMANKGINIKSYWKNVIKDPEISFLMMIVDDNGSESGMKRKDLLDPNMKYIGISSTEINGFFVCYMTLSPIA